MKNPNIHHTVTEIVNDIIQEGENRPTIEKKVRRYLIPLTLKGKVQAKTKGFKHVVWIDTFNK